MSRNISRVAAVVIGACALVSPALAATITDGFTYAVASGGDTSVGNHFHSNTGGAFGNPAGKAEVGQFSYEAVRGLSEYNLSGLSAAASAFVSFDVYSTGGLFSGVNSFSYLGPITIEAYQGNNSEDIADFQAASIGTVGSFSTVGLTTSDILSFDITSIFNDAIAAGWSSLGIRLAATGTPNGGAFTFDQFRLTADNQSTVDPGTSVVPLPAGAPLLLGGIAAFGLLRRRRR